MIRKKLSILLFILLVLIGVFYFQKEITGLFLRFGEKLEKIRELDFEQAIKDLQKQVFTPSPLNVGGSQNENVLTKEKIIIETNIQRQNNGNLPSLKENSLLTAAAKAKAEDMFTKKYFDHISPSGTGPSDLVSSFGYEYIITGENLIMGNFDDEADVVQKWMDSPGHRENILNKRYTEIGVAVIRGVYNGQRVWIGVQQFGFPLSACGGVDESLKKQIDFNKSELGKILAQLQEKQREINRTNRNSPKYNQLVDEYNAMVLEYNYLSDKTENLILQYNAEVNSFNACVND